MSTFHKQPPVPSTAALLSNQKSTRSLSNSKTSSPINSPKPTKQKDKKDYPMLPPSIPSSAPAAFFLQPRIRHPPTSISALLKLNKLKFRSTGEKHDALSYSSQQCQSQNKISSPSSHSSGVKPEILHPHEQSYPQQPHPLQPQSRSNQDTTGSPSVASEKSIANVRPKIPIAATSVKGQDSISVPPTPPNKSNQLLSHDLANLVQSEIQKMNDTASVTAPTTGTSTPEAVVMQRVTDESTGSRSQNDTPLQYPCPPTPDTPATGDVDENDIKCPKVYVLKACVACKNSHVACDVNRPCQRCVRLGKANSCVDAERKKRGRPCSNFKNSSNADGGEYSGSDGSESDSDASMSSSVSLSSRHLSKSARLGSAEVDLAEKTPTRTETAVIGVNECDPELFDIATALLMTSRSQDSRSSPQCESQTASQSETGESSTGDETFVKAGSPTETEISVTEDKSPILANRKTSLTENIYSRAPKQKIQSSPNRIDSSQMQTLRHEHLPLTPIEGVNGTPYIDESTNTNKVSSGKVHAVSAGELPISERTPPIKT